MNAQSISNAVRLRLSDVWGATVDASGAEVAFFADEQTCGTALVSMPVSDARMLLASLLDLYNDGKLGEKNE